MQPCFFGKHDRYIYRKHQLKKRVKNKEQFDTHWIVELLKEQHPKKINVIENLKNCKEGHWISKAHIISTFLG